MNFIRQLQYRYRLSTAVKEALDSLPEAVCYFTPSGSVKLCNKAMYEVYRKLTQSDLQSFEELTEAVENCDETTGIIRQGNVFLFPDGHARQYSVRKVTTPEGRVYTETVFSDVTELYIKSQELQHQSKEMKKMYKELVTLSGQLLEVTREREILNMKVLLHDQMNMGITAIRQVLRQNTVSEKNAAAIEQFRRAIQVLQEDTENPQNELFEFIRDAKVSGVLVNIVGDLPKEEKIHSLIVAVLREACVNAVRHADAAQLNVVSEMNAHTVTVRITNDGEQPKKEITARGGLKDLKNRIEKVGGTMEICSMPEFILTVILPVKGTDRRGEA